MSTDWTKDRAAYFRSIYEELIDENPLAARAVLQVLHVEFTDAVPTLAVTCEERPRLLVNLDFVWENCETEKHIKAVILHEFLHVLLRHTERFEGMSPALHLALDAVINSIIHRELGEDYSGMMSRYYGDAQGIFRLLRPPKPDERAQVHECRWPGHMNPWRAEPYREPPKDAPFLLAWDDLYFGRLLSDDIEELAKDLGVTSAVHDLIGGHGDVPGASGILDSIGAGGCLPEVLEDAIGRALKTMNGYGIWRSPRDRGVGTSTSMYRSAVDGANVAVTRWKRETYAILKRYLQPDRQRGARERQPVDCVLPVLSPSDRRAVLRSLWTGFLPDAHWAATAPKPGGTAHVYLDVSGSMHAEMPLLVTLLGRLSSSIRKPLWAFSNEVARARIKDGQLVAETSGGTAMSCVLEHLVATRPASAVVITDGYIERLDPALVRAANGTRLHVLVTRDGDTSALDSAGILTTQLSEVPS